MNKQEELQYLTDLLLQASRWHMSEDEVLSGLELEVQDRIRRLMGVNTEDAEGFAQSEVGQTDREVKPSAPDWCTRFSQDNVRVRLSDGRQHWVGKEHCHKVPRKDKPTMWMWALLPEYVEQYEQKYNLK